MNSNNVSSSVPRNPLYDWIYDAPTLPDDDSQPSFSGIEDVQNPEETLQDPSENAPIRYKLCRIRDTRPKFRPYSVKEDENGCSTTYKNEGLRHSLVYRREEQTPIPERPRFRTAEEMERDLQLERQKRPLAERYPRIVELILQPSIFDNPSKRRLEREQEEERRRKEKAAQDEHIAALFSTSFEYALPDSTTTNY